MLYVLISGRYELCERVLEGLTAVPVRIVRTGEFFPTGWRKLVSNVLSLAGLPCRHLVPKSLRAELSPVTPGDSVLLWFTESVPLNLAVRSLLRAGKVSLYIWNTWPSDFLHRIGMSVLRRKMDVYLFDSRDAARTGARYKPNVCYDIAAYDVPPCHGSDVYFVGSDKGRYAALEEIRNVILSQGCSADFNVSRDETSPALMDERMELHGSISFLENIAHIRSSRCVLELVKEGQSGLSLRFMEAMLSGRKLITNNAAVLSLPFCPRRNVFLLGTDSMDSIGSFIKEPFFDYGNGWEAAYGVNSWIMDFV